MGTQKQFVGIALVSKDEILNENFSIFKDFTRYLHALSDKRTLQSRVVYHERIAVALNAGAKNFYEHGECRLLDPSRKLLFEIIDEEIESKTGNIMDNTNKIITFDKGGKGVLKNMKKSYTKLFHGLNDSVILLFSYFIPCSIDFYNCSRLIHKFVNVSGLNMAICYESIYKFSDKCLSLSQITMENVVVVDCDEIWTEIRSQIKPLINTDTFRFKYEFLNGEYDNDFDDDFEDFADDVLDFRKSTRMRQFGKALCRKMMKRYNNFISLK
ncbi:uncharacterized protein LOC132734835 [Ruditapes philippinarum]|uniref:uncharacterized protein LOC132734835 n=1 Tax=Ruditapes philippinarum TaxID=129788 RepID=UPI00295AEC26|nr:uncharacterized protein LOC132734835 [Ruditapes philippinarum]